MLVRKCDKCFKELNISGKEGTTKKVITINGMKKEVCKDCYDGLCSWIKEDEKSEYEDFLEESKKKFTCKEIITYYPIWYYPIPTAPVWPSIYSVGGAGGTTPFKLSTITSGNIGGFGTGGSGGNLN